MNLYVAPEALRKALKIDTQNAMPVEELEPILEETSRYIDDELGRWFYVLSDTRYYDGPGSSEFWLPDDVISITTLKVDGTGDGTYETTYTEGTDFQGWPYNGPHFRRLDVISGRGSLDTWPTRAKSIEIVGTFGWEQRTTDLGITGTVADATTTTITAAVGDTGLIEVGQTVLIESEQMYVTSRDADSFEVERGVNGTTAAAHSAKTIYRYEYPPALVSAIKMEAARWYREHATGFAGMVSSFNESGYASFRQTWPAIMARLGTYRTADRMVSV